MVVWIIDDGPLDVLAMVVDADVVASWPTGCFRIADATRDAASGRRRDLLARQPSPLAPFSVMMGSPAADVLYSHLRDPSASDKDLAEQRGS